MKEKIKGVMPRSDSVIYKTVKEGQQSFRITKKLLDSLYKNVKLAIRPLLIITIPANKAENYVVTCTVKKEKK